MVTATIRMTMRLRAQRLLQLDDFFLIFACVCLTGATAVLNWGISPVYQVLQLQIEPFRAELPKDLSALIAWFQTILFTYIPLSWAAIFAAKFSYLCFFRHLVDRIRPMVIYWRVVVAVIAMSATLCILQAPISCPHMDSQARKFVQLLSGFITNGCRSQMRSRFGLQQIFQFIDSQHDIGCCYRFDEWVSPCEIMLQWLIS